jgi:rRNA maturation protein Rpf1
MVVCHLPYGPTAYFGIFNTVLRHDIGQKKEVGTISEAYPHLIFDQFSSKLGARVGNILKHLFPVGDRAARQGCCSRPAGLQCRSAAVLLGLEACQCKLDLMPR